MVGRKKQRGKKVALAGSHQKCWLWGRHAVLESLSAGRWLPLEVRYDPALVPPADQQRLESLTQERGLTCIAEPGSRLSQLCGARDHQGLIAQMPPYPYADLPRTLAALNTGSLVLVLCGIQDPFNFGSLLRSADVFGVDACIVPDRGQADVTPHVARSSAGGVNYVPIARADDLAAVCEKFKEIGLTVMAATEKGTLPAAAAPRAAGVALVIGNEGAGVPEDVLRRCDRQVRIPQFGHVGSLNAAVAAGILLYELRRSPQSISEPRASATGAHGVADDAGD